MLQSLGPRGSPKLQPPLLPQAKWWSAAPLAEGSSKAETVEGKGDRRERRGKGGERVVLWQEAAPRGPPAPRPRPQMWSQACRPCPLPGRPNNCYEKGCRVCRETAGWVWGWFLSPQTFRGPFKTRVPAVGRYGKHVGAGARWAGVGPTAVEIEAPGGQDGEQVKIFGLGFSGVQPVGLVFTWVSQD